MKVSLKTYRGEKWGKAHLFVGRFLLRVELFPVSRWIWGDRADPCDLIRFQVHRLHVVAAWLPKGWP